MQKTKDQLKEMFSDGKTPDGRDFADLIDSCRNETDREIYVDGVPLAESVRGKATKDELESARQSLQRKIDAKGADILSLETQIGQIAGQIDSMPACQCDTSQFYTKGEVDSMLANIGGGGADSDGPSCGCDMSQFVTRDELVGGEAGDGMLSDYYTKLEVDDMIMNIGNNGGGGGGDGAGSGGNGGDGVGDDAGSGGIRPVVDVDNFETVTKGDLSKSWLHVYTSYSNDYWKFEELTEGHNFYGVVEIRHGRFEGNPCLIFENFDGFYLQTDYCMLISSCITSFRQMFKCKNLRVADIENWNTSFVTDMEECFYGSCYLAVLKISTWDTSSVTNMRGTFRYTDIRSLDLNGWDVSHVTTMRETFMGCHSLYSLGIKWWDTSSVTTMESMFLYCDKLKEIDLGGWDVSSVTNMSFMFAETDSLRRVDLSGWSLPAECDCSDMFHSSALNPPPLTIRMAGCSAETIAKIDAVKPSGAVIVTE